MPAKGGAQPGQCEVSAALLSRETMLLGMESAELTAVVVVARSR
jgi:hypothetical protein